MIQPPEHHISVVVPCYRCAMYIQELCARLHAVLPEISEDYQIVLVNDASPDKDWEAIEVEAQASPKVVGLDLSRNFGQHYAITAGLMECTNSAWTVVMDGDLQDVPEEIPKLYKRALTGFDSVQAQRENRQDSIIRRATSKGFYMVLSYLTDTSQDPTIANFGVFNRKVVRAITSMPEKVRYFPVLVRWIGFRWAAEPVEHHDRQGSASSYTWSKMAELAVNIMLAFSDKPLRLVTKLGFLLSMISSVGVLVICYRWMIGLVSVQGWASLMATIGLLGGLTIFIVGMVGLYVGKTFDEVKRRPLFLVRERTDAGEVES